MWQERTELLLGKEGLESLRRSSVAVIGVGGVGAAAAEMLVRSGVGHIMIVDNDSFSQTNINRQIPALHSTVGKMKVDVVGERLLDINPQLDILRRAEYVHEDSVESVFDGFRPDYVVDAIDTLSPKVALIKYCLDAGIPLVSSMGSGAKIDISSIRIADISRTRQCPLAHMLRKRLHKMGISTGFDAVYSEEPPRREAIVIEESRNKKSQVGTISYLPAVFGCACAQRVITRLAGIE